MMRISGKDVADLAVMCGALVYRQEPFATWAARWLSGEDRSWETAQGVRVRPRPNTYAGAVAYVALATAMSVALQEGQDEPEGGIDADLVYLHRMGKGGWLVNALGDTNYEVRT